MPPIAESIYQQGFYVTDNFLKEKDYLALRSFANHLKNNDLFKPAKIGHQQQQHHNSMIRSDQIFWIDPEDNHFPLTSYFAKLDDLCSTLNQTLYMGLTSYEAHFAVYQANNFYKKHIDQFSGNRERRISCVYYLNEDWQIEDGGALRLYDRQEKLLLNIMPKGNRFVCFESDLPHEVCTAYQVRYSIAAWLKVRPMGSNI